MTAQPLPPILAAAEKNDLEKVFELIDSGADLNARGPGRWTALHEAAQLGNADMCRALLDAGANVSAKDVDGMAALHHAARYDHPQVVRALVEGGADVEQQGFENRTPLFQAALYGSSQAWGALLEAGADAAAQSFSNYSGPMNTQRHASGITPLHAAAACGDAVATSERKGEAHYLACARALLQAGAEVNQAEQHQGWSLGPLNRELLQSQVAPLGNAHTADMAQVLIDHGATLGGLDSGEPSPFGLAAGRKNLEVAAAIALAGYEPSTGDMAKLQQAGATPEQFNGACERLEAQRLERRLEARFEQRQQRSIGMRF